MYALFYKFDPFIESYVGFSDYLLTAIASVFIGGILCLPVLIASIMWQGAKAPMGYDQKLIQEFKLKSRPFYAVVSVVVLIIFIKIMVWFKTIAPMKFDLSLLATMWGMFLLAYFIHKMYDYKKTKPAPEPSRIQKKETANGLGTLGQSLKHTLNKGTPLVTYSGKEMNETAFNERYKPIHKKWAFHRAAFRVTNEDRGIILGAPGSGKTTYLISQLLDWMKSGQSFVATDVKPEIWAILKANGAFDFFGYKDWVFNPTDADSDHYNIFSEMEDSAEFNEVLNIIIPDSMSEETSVFTDNARRLLKAVLIELGEKASLPNAQRYINSMDDNAELLKSLRQSDNETVSNIAKEISRSAKSENLLASIMTSVSRAFVFLDDDRIRKTISDNADGFYLKDVLTKPKQAVFLQFDQKYKNSTASLFGAMVAHTLRILQAHQNRKAVFVALDEIINCAPIPKFIDSLNTMRSANMPTFIYLQALEGLNRLYGVNADRLFMGSGDYKAVFKINDIDTAKQFSELIGQTETTYRSDSASNVNTSSRGQSGTGSNASSGSSSSNSVSVSSKMEYIVEPEKFTRLPMCTAVVFYNGTFGTLEMPKYWEFFNMPKRLGVDFTEQTIGDFKRAEKVA